MKYPKSRNAWMRSEIETLKRIWPTSSKADIYAALPRHTHASIEKTAANLKIGRRRVQRHPGGVRNALWKLRESKRITRKRLCDFTGFHPIMFGRWERGEASPTIQRLEEWCDALGVELTLQPKARGIKPVGFDPDERLP